jgi:hypothetical protein
MHYSQHPSNAKMRNLTPSSGQNCQLVFWWVLVHANPLMELVDDLLFFLIKGHSHMRITLLVMMKITTFAQITSCLNGK